MNKLILFGTAAFGVGTGIYIYLNFGSQEVDPQPGGLYNDDKYCCYMNSMIQALASSDVIINQFVTLKIENEISSTLLDEFINILQSVNNNNLKVANNTKKLKDLIKKIDWIKMGEQDAYEFLCVLINGIHDEIRMQLDNKQINMPMKMKLLHKHNTISKENVIQEYVALSIELCGNYSEKPGVSLNYLIDNHLIPKTIDGNANSTIQVNFYKKIPDVLVLHIQATKWDCDKRKMIIPKYYITYSSILLLNLDIVDDVNGSIKRCENIKYKLCAVIQHVGSSARGSYVTYRQYMNYWYLLNDEHVQEVQFNYDARPYILIYEIL